jgi:hypothetical protein
MASHAHIVEEYESPLSGFKSWRKFKRLLEVVFPKL